MFLLLLLLPTSFTPLLILSLPSLPVFFIAWEIWRLLKGGGGEGGRRGQKGTADLESRSSGAEFNTGAKGPYLVSPKVGQLFP